jgi:hypothetical protein
MTSTARVQALRDRRTSLGLTRLEIYAHPADHAAIKALAAKLTKKRTQTTLPPSAERTARRRD